MGYKISASQSIIPPIADYFVFLIVEGKMKNITVLILLFLCQASISFAQAECSTVEACKKIIIEQRAEIDSLKKKLTGKTTDAKSTIEWKLIGTSGISKFICVSPQGLNDKHYLAQILNQVARNTRIVEISFFDDCKNTPASFPMTDSQMRHLKARYNFNASTGHEQFVFIKSGKETRATIRPGYAE